MEENVQNFSSQDSFRRVPSCQIHFFYPLHDKCCIYRCLDCHINTADQQRNSVIFFKRKNIKDKILIFYMFDLNSIYNIITNIYFTSYILNYIQYISLVLAIIIFNMQNPVYCMPYSLQSIATNLLYCDIVQCEGRNCSFICLSYVVLTEQ